MFDTKILTLTLTAFILGVESQVIANCTASSPQCCWVVRSWQLMGQTTSVSSTSPSACCSMRGVTCDFTYKVIYIDWNSRSLLVNKLSGSIPAEIGNLINLKELALGGHQLSGSIPAWIGNLTNLQSLWLYNNSLSGSIPAEIGNLINLQNLYLYINQLSGSIPAAIGNLTNLQRLYLYNNQLSGSIPAEIGNLRNLQWLYLYINQLSGSIPAAIGNLINLQRLYLYNNQLSGSIPAAIGNLKSLQMLYLDNNQLSGSIPAAIGKLINLQWLRLNDNPSLSGAFKPTCGMKVYASNTAITLCGCATSVSAVFIFPPAGTSLACLATGPATPLTKRIQVFSQNIEGYRVTCNTDSNDNPYQDCLNAQAAFCDPTFISSNATRITYCKNAIDNMARVLSSYWQNVRINCGQWSFNGNLGSWTSSNCINANNALKANAYYLMPDGTKGYVTEQLIDSVNRGLWGNSVLKA